MTYPLTAERQNNGLERFGSASGAFAFVLALAGIVVSATTGVGAANPGANAEQIALAYGTAAPSLVWLGAMLQMLAFLFLFAFCTFVCGIVGAASTRGDWLRNLATGSGQAFVILTLAGFAIGGIARFRAGPGLDLSLAMALFDIHVAIYVASWAIGAVFLLATAGLIRQSRGLPAWLGVAAIVCAAICLAAVALPTSPVAGLPSLVIWLWTLGASVTLLRRGTVAAWPSVTMPSAV